MERRASDDRIQIFSGIDSSLNRVRFRWIFDFENENRRLHLQPPVCFLIAFGSVRIAFVTVIALRFARFSAIGATYGIVFKSFFPIKSLLGFGKNKFVSAVLALNRLVCHIKKRPPFKIYTKCFFYDERICLEKSAFPIC